jgi:hypothetical protein
LIGDLFSAAIPRSGLHRCSAEGAEGKQNEYVVYANDLAAISQAVEGKDWEPYWKDHQENWFNFIGKDTSFSPVIFPAMLSREAEVAFFFAGQCSAK